MPKSKQQIQAERELVIQSLNQNAAYRGDTSNPYTALSHRGIPILTSIFQNQGNLINLGYTDADIVTIFTRNGMEAKINKLIELTPVITSGIPSLTTRQITAILFHHSETLLQFLADNRVALNDVFQINNEFFQNTLNELVSYKDERILMQGLRRELNKIGSDPLYALKIFTPAQNIPEEPNTSLNAGSRSTTSESSEQADDRMSIVEDSDSEDNDFSSDNDDIDVDMSDLREERFYDQNEMDAVMAVEFEKSASPGCEDFIIATYETRPPVLFGNGYRLSTANDPATVSPSVLPIPVNGELPALFEIEPTPETGRHSPSF